MRIRPTFLIWGAFIESIAMIASIISVSVYLQEWEFLRVFSPLFAGVITLSIFLTEKALAPYEGLRRII